MSENPAPAAPAAAPAPAPAAAPAAAPAPAPAPSPAAAPHAAAGGEFPRARWVEARMKEMPRYCMFLYNLLLDAKLPDYYKEHAFAALFYILEGGDLIPADDKMLNGIDEITYVYRCISELIGRLPQASLAIYEEVLHRDSISIRDLMVEAPTQLGPFFFALSAVYKDRVQKQASFYKNAIKTGLLVKLLQSFLGSYRFEPFPPERLKTIEAFLASFKM
jgi:hypothetical protein